MNRWHLSLLALVAFVCAFTSSVAAGAATCTINGTVAVEPLDGYYCDTTFGSCSGWKVVDLDVARGATAKRLPYMRMEVWQGSTYLGRTHTSATGAYSITFTVPGSTCAGQSVSVRHWMERIHEADLNASTKRYRFAIVAYQANLSEDQMVNRYYVPVAVALTGTSTTVSATFVANQANPNIYQRVANLYFTVNAAMTEIVQWTSRLESHFRHTSSAADGIFRVVYGPEDPNGGGNFMGTWGIRIGFGEYNRGSLTRHELGHAVREALHDRKCSFNGGPGGNGCSTYGYNFVGNYNSDTCEYGSAAFNEGIASFFGTRTATAHDTNVWDCRCRDNYNQGICSQMSNNLTTPDRVQACPSQGGDFVGIGDRWIVSSATCKRLNPNGGCNDCATGTDGFCVPFYSALWGWRNVVQVQRFLWDLIDTSTDGGTETIDYSIGSLITAMQAMPTGWGVDGSCRESEKPPSAACNPATNGLPVTGGTGSRDAYNPKDISDLLPEDLAGVMHLNCVGFATDN